MKPRRIVGSSLLLVAFLVGLGAATNWSQEGAGETLSERVGKLEKEVEKLRLRVAHLEERLSVGAPSAEAAGPARWRDERSWRSLSKGMTKDDVIHILGEPVKTSRSTSIEIWYYPDAAGGWVSFDESGQVLGWTQP
ncbi:MAG: hypothetical protein ACE5JR_11585 [Gemmatimonadota bacterium]